MGFFDRKAREETECAVCNELNNLKKTQLIDNELACSGCTKKIDLKYLMELGKPIKRMTVEEVKNALEVLENKKVELASFNPTKKIGTFVEFDDNQKKWLILSAMFGNRDKSTVYNYSDILNFELLEDGESISQGGLGRALAGGVLFGGAGAIVGGVTGKRKNKSICNSLKMKITLRDMNNPVVYINFLTSPTKRDGFIFKGIYQAAQECLSVLQLICDQQEVSSAAPMTQASFSNADELMKFKGLLDAGIISQEEFEVKKRELLNS